MNVANLKRKILNVISAVFKDHATSSLGIQDVTTQGNAFSRVSLFTPRFDIFGPPFEPVQWASTERTSCFVTEFIEIHEKPRYLSWILSRNLNYCYVLL